MIPRSEILTLTQLQGIGPSKLRQIITSFRDCDSIKHLSITDICSLDGLSRETARKVVQADFADGELQLEKITSMACNYLTILDKEYPQHLKNIYMAPAGIITRGQVNYEKSIAIVGTRNLSPYGRKMSAILTIELVKQGFAIISGFARGIDSVCHKTALENNGITIGVLGCGIDVVYPRENKSLYRKMWQQGGLVSEFLPGAIPDARNFPKRNRIISGMTLGTIVIEAGRRSGAILTAYYALDQNREVFAVPGRIDSSQSDGCNHIIKQGAKLIVGIDDIMNEFSYLKKTNVPEQTQLIPELNEEEKLIYNLLSHEPLHIDTISKLAEMTSPKILAILLTLELKNTVVQLPGKLFQKQ